MPVTTGQKQKPLTEAYCPKKRPSVTCVIVGCAYAPRVMLEKTWNARCGEGIVGAKAGRDEL